MRWVLVASLVGLASAPAVAEPVPADAPGHRGQLLASARLAFGLRGIATYEDATFCGDTDATAANGFAPVCTGRAPVAIDVELGYGVGRAIDLLLELRVGLERDFGATPTSDDGARPFHVSPGARFFFGEGGRTKLFTTAQLVFDFAGYQDASGASLGRDFGVRNTSGLWVDLDRAYGVYLFIGETATFSRWLRFELEAGIGVQVRYR